MSRQMPCTSQLSRLMLPCTLLLLAFAGTATGQTFQQVSGSNQGYKTGAGPQQVLVGDFNGDNKLDFITVDVSGQDFTVYLNEGGGNYPDYGTQRFPTVTPGPIKGVVADFNGDGKLDVAIVANGIGNSNTQTTSGAVEIFYGNGDGTFVHGPTVVIPNSQPNSITAFDYNKDRHIDLAVASYRSNDITVLANSGSAFSIALRFTPLAGVAPFGITSADFDQNGTGDLAFTVDNNSNSIGSYGVYLALNNGSGGFSTRKVGSIGFPALLNAVNMDNDKYPDIAVGDWPHSRIMLFRNPGSASPSVHTAAINSTIGYVDTPQMADLDGDGIPDLVAGMEGDQFSGFGYVAGVARGTGGGSFAAMQYLGGIRQANIGDVNGDKRVDVIGENGRSEGFYVYANTSPTFGCAAFALPLSFDLCQPANPTTTSPVRVQGSGNLPNPVDHIEVWDNGKKIDQIFGNHIDRRYSFSAGQHAVSLVTVDAVHNYQKDSFTLQIGSSAPGACSTGANLTVSICSPAAGSTVSSTVTVAATARWDNTIVTHMRIYVDGVDRFDVNNPAGKSVKAQLTIAAGSHTLTVVAWNGSGQSIKGSETFTVH